MKREVRIYFNKSDRVWMRKVFKTNNLFIICDKILKEQKTERGFQVKINKITDG